MIAVTQDRASKRQIAFITRLAEEREMPEADRDRLLWKLAEHNSVNDVRYFEFTNTQARLTIKWLLRREVRAGYVKDHISAMPKADIGPRPGSEANYSAAEGAKRRLEARNLTPATRAVRRDPSTLLTSGVFRLNNETYIIVPTKSGKHIAKRWVETPPRLTSSGETVKFDWVAAPGVIWALEEEHRLPVADIEAMLVEHRVCIYPGCYITLKAAKSVSAGAGKRHAEKLGIPWGGKRKEA
jgi:hypothetical protein